jgi:hypothetical protein
MKSCLAKIFNNYEGNNVCIISLNMYLGALPGIRGAEAQWWKMINCPARLKM